MKSIQLLKVFVTQVQSRTLNCFAHKRFCISTRYLYVRIYRYVNVTGKWLALLISVWGTLGGI